MNNITIKTAGTLLKALSIALTVCLVGLPDAWAKPAMVEYTAVPPFVEQATVKPNILIMLDNSGSMNEYVYRNEPYNSEKTYYGYFTSEYRYNHTSNRKEFQIDHPGGPWCGNFLNYLTMRRIDVTRKVLFGGYMHSATGTGSQRVTVDDAPDSYQGMPVRRLEEPAETWPFELSAYVHFVESGDLEDVDMSDVSPYDNTHSFYMNNDGEMEVLGPDHYLYKDRQNQHRPWKVHASGSVAVLRLTIIDPKSPTINDLRWG